MLFRSGYEEAYAIIGDLRNRLEVQGEEYKAALEEGYEEAYQMLKAEQAKNQQLEVDMYEEYDRKLAEMKEYIVDKVDEFLQVKGVEIYEQAKRDLMADPRMVEHKVALDKIVNIASDYIAGDEQFFSTSGKLDEARKSVEDLKGQLRIMEARNIRLSTENTKLNESVRRASEVISESRVNNTKRIVNEQKERGVKAKSVSGRGQLITENVQVITESASGNADNDLLVLSGIKKAK